MTVNTPAPPAPTTRPCGCPEDQAAGFSRRNLFRFASLAGAAGLVTVRTLSDAGLAFGASTNSHVLVVLSLRGGFDGLSAVVPAGDPAYLAKRPGIGIPASRLKQVDSMFGLHPAMAPLYPLWNAGKLAAVHAVGQQDPTRSHFAAMEELERAAPGSSLRTGWLDRTLGVVGDDAAFTGTQVGSPDLPGSLTGPHRKFAMNSIRDVKLAIGEDEVPLSRWQQAVRTLHAGARPTLSTPLTAAINAVGLIRPLQAADTSDQLPAGYPQNSNLAKGLHDVALLVKANLGLRLATVDYDNWDMHVGVGGVDGGWMHDQLTEMSSALAGFATELGPDLDRVTLITLSEFGRRVEQNGSGGLDHGHGNAVLALGGGLAGGGKVHGRWPGLSDAHLDQGDLAGTTDYRSIVAEVLDKRFGVGSMSTVFPGLKPSPVGLA